MIVYILMLVSGADDADKLCGKHANVGSLMTQMNYFLWY